MINCLKFKSPLTSNDRKKKIDKKDDEDGDLLDFLRIEKTTHYWLSIPLTSCNNLNTCQSKNYENLINKEFLVANISPLLSVLYLFCSTTSLRKLWRQLVWPVFWQCPGKRGTYIIVQTTMILACFCFTYSHMSIYLHLSLHSKVQSLDCSEALFAMAQNWKVSVTLSYLSHFLGINN